MSLDNVLPGKNIPTYFNVIIEIPMNADPIKYEVDKESGAIFVDRFMGTAMHYPTNYGYVPKTISGDGDPVDVLVVTPFPLIPGVVVSCRAVGILEMEDIQQNDGCPLVLNETTDSIDNSDLYYEYKGDLQHNIKNFRLFVTEALTCCRVVAVAQLSQLSRAQLC